MHPGIVKVQWNAPPGVHAVYTTRAGGVSAGAWHAFNLGDHVGDDPQAVAHNRGLLREAASLPAEPHWLQQVHGVNVVDLDGFGATGADKPVADAAISTTTGVVCAVLTADCLPVLFASDDGLIVGAAHAGWRGLAAGVLENTVATMRARMPAAMVLRAWLGPAIGPRHFEVGEEVRAAFVNADAAAVSAFEQHGDRWHADLFALARQRLTRLGVEQVTGGEQCTYTDSEQFFSHRRDVQHRGLPSTGRMAALIWRER